MAFGLPSLQDEYVLISSFDPALDLPEVPNIDRETASVEDIEKVEALIKERTRKLDIARDHGRYDDITKQGEKPTLFHFKHIHAKLKWLRGQVDRDQLSEDESFELAFRLALVSIENLGKIEVKRTKEQPTLVADSTMERLYDIGRDDDKPLLGQMIVHELGALVLYRAVQGVRPLS